MNQLVRPLQGRVLGGVCAAVANRFGWNVTAVRVVTTILVLFGLTVLIYLLLWVIIPSAPA